MHSGNSQVTQLGGTNRPTRRYHLNGYAMLLFPALVAVLVLYVTPLVGVLGSSFVDGDQLTSRWYEELLLNEQSIRIILRTLKLVAITTIVSITIGYVFAYVLHFSEGATRFWLAILLLLPFWMSLLVRTLSWLIMLRENGVVNGLLLASHLLDQPIRFLGNEIGVVIGMVHYMIPYAVFPIYSTMRGVDPRIRLAARSVGASPFRAFWDVFFPMTRSGVLAAALLVSVLGMGVFVTPGVLGAGRVVMLSEYVSISVLNLMRIGVGSAVCAVMLVASLSAILVAHRLVGIRGVAR